MKKLMLLTLALSLVVASAAMAQPEPRDVGVFGDAAGTQTSLNLSAAGPFMAYVVGFGLDGQVKGFEFQVTANPGLVAQLVTLPGGYVNLGDAPGEYIVGTGGCLEGEPSIELLALPYFWFAGADLEICVGGGVSPSSFDGAVPGYLQCDGSLVPFGVATNGEAGGYPNGCLIINPTSVPPVSTEAVSFGEVKGRF